MHYHATVTWVFMLKECLPQVSWCIVYSHQVNYRCVGETKCTMNLLSDSCAVRRSLWGRTLLLVCRHSVVVTDWRAGSCGSPDETSRSSACGHQLTIWGSPAFVYRMEKSVSIPLHFFHEMTFRTVSLKFVRNSDF